MGIKKYTPTTWIGGKTIGTADVMNNIEDGIVALYEHIDSSISHSDVPQLNVKDFGAIGDGVTDDVVAIQSALNLARELNGAKIYVPKGVYLLGTTLEIYANTHLKLDDNAIFRRSLKGNMALNGTVGGLNPQSNITIEGGTWDMDNNHTRYYGGGHITFGKSKNIKVLNVTFLNNHGNHSLDIAGVEDMVIRDCKFKGFWINPAGDRDYVEAVQISDFTEAGQPIFASENAEQNSLVFDGSSCNNILVENCIFEKNENNSKYIAHSCGIGNHSATEGTRSSNVTIRKCKFVGCSHYGIRPFSYDNTTIDDCVFIDCGEGVHITSVGKGDMSTVFQTPLPAINTKIINCYFKNIAKYGVWSTGKQSLLTSSVDLSYSDGLFISNCVFDTSTVADCSAIKLELNKNVQITGCKFKDVQRGIHLSSCDNVTIKNNDFDNTVTEGIFTSITTQISNIYNNNVIVDGNTLRDIGRTGIFIRYTDYLVSCNNFIYTSSKDEPNARNAISVSGCKKGYVYCNFADGETNKVGVDISSSCTNIVDFNNMAKGLTSSTVNSSKTE